MKTIDINKMLQQAGQEALDIAQGKLSGKTHRVLISTGENVSKLRKTLNLSRSEFSQTYKLNPRTLEKWEQSQNKMDTTARAYLTAIANAPEAIKKALNS